MSRLVVLTGTLETNQIFATIESARSAIQTALANDGFDIVSVRMNQYAPLSSITANITIECNVDDVYTAEQARQRAIQVISSISDWMWGSMFTNVNLQVLSDGRSVNPIPDSTSNTVLNNIAQGTGNAIQKSITDLASNSGGLVTLAIVGAVVYFVISNRR